MHLSNRILAVDDNTDNLAILKELLEREFTIICVESGEEALRIAPIFRPNVVLLDLMMPGLNGKQTCRLLRQEPALKDTKIVMLSARTAIEDRLESYDLGAVDYITKPFNDLEVAAKVRAWMKMVHKQEVDEVWQEIHRTRDVVGFAMTTLAAFRDTETGEHLFRLRWYSYLLAEQLSVTGPYCSEIDEQFLRQLYRASPLHDIGKVGIDDAILRKPGPLTAQEFEQIKEHSAIGGDILARTAAELSSADYVQMAAVIARHHHERFDGTGYPDGLSGTAIPLPARIVAPADVFDALTSDRVYRKAISVDEASAIIEQESGSHFDPAVVEAFQSRFEEFCQAHAMFADGYLTPMRTDLIGDSGLGRPNDCLADHSEHRLGEPFELPLPLFDNLSP
jgi:putative two-component system response regulator